LAPPLSRPALGCWTCWSWSRPLCQSRAVTDRQPEWACPRAEPRAERNSRRSQPKGIGGFCGANPKSEAGGDDREWIPSCADREKGRQRNQKQLSLATHHRTLTPSHPQPGHWPPFNGGRTLEWPDIGAAGHWSDRTLERPDFGATGLWPIQARTLGIQFKLHKRKNGVFFFK
jgi:hypothetical protein